MKIKLFSKVTLFGLLTVGSLFIASCKKDHYDEDDVKYDLSGNATGSQEVPAVTATAAASLSPALPGVNALPLIDLSITINGVDGKITGSATIHDTIAVHLLSGRLYYNIPTVAHPNGEIRGQVQPLAD